MKHLITTDNGGFPFDADDIRWAEAGFNEDITAILKAYSYTQQPTFMGTPPPYSLIIFGCQLSGNNTAGYTWTAGGVLIDGVIYRVDASVDPVTHTAGELMYFTPSVITDPAGNENFEDGTPHDTYGIRVATVSVQTVGQDMLAFEPVNTPRYLSGLLHVPKRYTIIGTMGAPAYGANFAAGAEPLGFRKNELNQVEFKGTVIRTSGGAASFVFSLPTGAHPAFEVNFVIHDLDNIAAQPNQVNIQPDGTVSIFGAVSATAIYDFGGIKFSTV